MYCSQCGNKVEPQSRYCASCGNSLIASSSDKSSPQPSENITIMDSVRSEDILRQQSPKKLTALDKLTDTRAKYISFFINICFVIASLYYFSLVKDIIEGGSLPKDGDLSTTQIVCVLLYIAVVYFAFYSGSFSFLLTFSIIIYLTFKTYSVYSIEDKYFDSLPDRIGRGLDSAVHDLSRSTFIIAIIVNVLNLVVLNNLLKKQRIQSAKTQYEQMRLVFTEMQIDGSVVLNVNSVIFKKGDGSQEIQVNYADILSYELKFDYNKSQSPYIELLVQKTNRLNYKIKLFSENDLRFIIDGLYNDLYKHMKRVVKQGEVINSNAYNKDLLSNRLK